MNISGLLQEFKTILVIAIIAVGVDYVYLNTLFKHFQKVFKEVQGDSLQIYLPGAIACYILIILSIYYFGFILNLGMVQMFLLGFFAYGIYETTNLATLRRWPIWMAIVDTLWGGILFMSVFSVTHFLIKGKPEKL